MKKKRKDEAPFVASIARSKAYAIYRTSSNIDSEEVWQKTDEYAQLLRIVSPLANRVLADERLASVIVAHLRGQKRDRFVSDLPSILLGEFPFKAAISNDCRDYDVFAWPLYSFIRSSVPQTEPGVYATISLINVMFLLVMQHVLHAEENAPTALEDFRTLEACQKAPLIEEKFGFLLRDVYTPGIDSTRFDLFSRLWNDMSLELNFACNPMQTQPLTIEYRVRTPRDCYAIEHDYNQISTSMRQNQEWLAPQFLSSIAQDNKQKQARLQGNILAFLSEEENEPLFPDVYPVFYELEDNSETPFGETKPDILLLDDTLTKDFAIRIWYQCRTTDTTINEQIASLKRYTETFEWAREVVAFAPTRDLAEKCKLYKEAEKEMLQCTSAPVN
jgi:hypothetical protein